MPVTENMQAVSPIQDHQVRIGKLRFGQKDAGGVAWYVVDVPSFSSVPLNAETGERAWADGGWVGPQWRTMSHFEIKLVLIADNPQKAGEQLQARVNAILEEAPIRDEQLVLVKRWLGWVGVKARCEEEIKVEPVSLRRWDVTIPMVASDPLKYVANPDSGELAWQVFETGLPRRSGGLTFPLRFPFLFDSEEESGSLEFRVQASVGRGLVEVVGPVADVSVFDTVAGWRFSYAGALLAGETLSVDPFKRTVTVNGVSRRGYFSGEWPNFGTGPHRVMWEGAGGQAGSRLRVRIVEAYL